MKNKQPFFWVIVLTTLMIVYIIIICTTPNNALWDNLTNKWIDIVISVVAYSVCGGALSAVAGGKRRHSPDRLKLVVAGGIFVWSLLYIMQFYALTHDGFFLRDFVLSLYRTGIFLTNGEFAGIVRSMLYVIMGSLAVRSFYED